MIVALLALLFASPPQVGMNVTGVDYWAGDRPFVDLVRGASDWRVETDADGWGRLYEHDLYANGTFALTDGGYPVPASGHLAERRPRRHVVPRPRPRRQRGRRRPRR